MRRNNTKKPGKDRYDHVYIEAPQCPWMNSMVADPIKTVFHNRAADPDARIVCMFRNVYDLEEFVLRYRVELF